MPFIHPIIFWTGLGAAATPVIIHLLNRRRFRVRDWAAMRFLLESMRRNRRRLRIEELILLAVRCLIVLLVAAALARFTGCGPTLPLVGDGSQTVVFVLDDSYSTGQKVGGSTLFSAATARLGERVEGLDQSDRVAIVRTSDVEADQPFFKPTYVANVDVESLTARLGALRPSDRRTSLADALDAAREPLAGGNGRKRLEIISDFRRADLSPPARAREIRERFAALRADGVEVIAWDLGREGRTNLTVESIELLERFAVADVPMRVAVSVRNHGTVRAENVELAVSVRTPDAAARLPAEVIQSISPGASARVEARLTAPSAGHAVITAALSGDELTADDSASLAVEVAEALKVLVVEGRGDVTDPTAGDAYFFITAVDPRRDGSYGVRPEVISADGLEDAELSQYDAVVLVNVPDLPARAGEEGLTCPAMEAMERYVADGGGLAIFTGEQVNLAFYNGPLYADGAGLMPYRIGAPVGGSARDEYVRLAPKSIAAHPALRSFAGQAAAMTGLIRFFGYHPAEMQSAPVGDERAGRPRTLASFTDESRSPAVVARKYGRGTVMTFFTTASTEWNDWAIDEMGTYVAVMNDMLSAIAKPGENLTGPVGEPIDVRLPIGFRDAAATLKTPDYPDADLIALNVVRGERDVEVRYERAAAAGVYELMLDLPAGGRTAVLLARNVDPAEGDLTPGGRDDISAAFGSEEYIYVPGAREVDRRVTIADAGQYWQWLLAGVLVLLATETYLGRRFGHYS